ncbi:hypothetical protein [Phenylobacterium sp.]|uniref:hypothetical protein n=1 Tax=Phenylobacterium sp. TaxID=1871053 RepID=UPI00120E8F6E|nr:hypothetical protein [Phenylobacterium sp.]THD57681.1 MAG: hypothetical protein E8A12_13180 [Phenylobacterium sp.]
MNTNNCTNTKILAHARPASGPNSATSGLRLSAFELPEDFEAGSGGSPVAGPGSGDQGQPSTPLHRRRAALQATGRSVKIGAQPADIVVPQFGPAVRIARDELAVAPRGAPRSNRPKEQT